MNEAIPTLESNATRRAILDAALVLFNERSMQRTTIEDVVQRSGISVGSIYHHFGDKEGIGFELYRIGIRDMHQTLLSRLESVDHFNELISVCVTDYLGWYQDHPTLGQHLFYYSDSRHLEDRAASIATLGRDFADRFVELGQARGMDAAFLEHAMLFITGGCREFLRFWLQQPDAQVLERGRVHLIELSRRCLNA